MIPLQKTDDGRVITELTNLHNWRENPRDINNEDLERLKAQITKLGQYKPLLCTPEGEVIGGNMRLRAYNALGVKFAWVSVVTPKDDSEKLEYALSDNDRAGYYVEGKLQQLLQLYPVDQTLYAIDVKPPLILDKLTGPKDKDQAHANLAEKFLVPPFSIMDTRQGYWQDRKKNWTLLIKDFGESREGTLGIESLQSAEYGKDMPTVSILDPVLAEVAVTWFAPKGGTTFDCFAGDSVFGYVSGYTKHEFTGIELRPEQAELNQKRCSDDNLPAKYICDDGQNILQHMLPESKDFLFSCPPYFDLEVYSDKPNDASNQETYADFLKILDTAFTGAAQVLKPNRFAVIVVGDIRDKNGAYYNFPDDIKKIFLKNGLHFYNDIILVNAIGTAAIRANNAFQNRKVVKVHQNVLVFYKGDIKNIKQDFGEVDLPPILNNEGPTDNLS